MTVLYDQILALTVLYDQIMVLTVLYDQILVMTVLSVPSLLDRGRGILPLLDGARPQLFFLRILVYLVIYDSGWVSREHLLLSWYPSQP